LVDWVITDASKFEAPSIKDIATGSGCIALGIASSVENSRVEGTDIDSNAINVAEMNAQKLGLNVHFKLEDALKLPNESERYDVIVSNPPYILKNEAKSMAKNVLDYEPHLALFVEKDALKFYKSITSYAESALKPNGALYFELHENYAQETIEWIKQNSALRVEELRKDLQGKDRMLKCIKG
jgi:release factor glutamine methyltransferase